MEAVYYAARANLRRLLGQEPHWTHQQYAAALGMSRGWVKKWKKRLLEAERADESVLHSRSRARQQAPERISQAVCERILQLRDEPPEGLRRTPGPRALLYYLPRDEQLQGERLPRSSRTVYRILRQAGRIAPPLPRLHEPLGRPAPLSHWELDFKDASTVPPEAEGKRQHGVEVLNVVDEGTSILVDAQVNADFHAETTLQAVADLFVRQGLPQAVRLDRDVRFVSSPSGSDFPSALLRFCACLGVSVLVCDPHQPQQKGFVERFNRTYQEECLDVDRPGTLAEVRAVTAAFAQYYNESRPHQGLSCGNRPPRVAFPTLPPLPALPELVDPDRWLQVKEGLALVRLVRRDGTVRVDLKSYYVSRALAGQSVALHLSAAKRALLVVHQHQVYKTLPLKGLIGHAMRFEAFVQLMCGQARAESRLRNAQQRRLRLGGFDSP
ncbi:MAG: integrase core domain-containing protein [Chloroflexota bacterium]